MRREKHVIGITVQVRHKLGCTTTEDDKRLEILDLGSRGIVQFMYCSENKGADRVRDRAADLRLYFHICKNRFSHDVRQLI